MFGSFLNVVVYRVPRKESVVKPRSRCPHCGRELTALDNVPVLSWLILRGRCRTCKAKISPKYLVGEIGTAVLWAAAFWRFDRPALAAVYAALFWVLLALTLIDLEHKLLPNAIVYPSTVVAVAAFAAVALAFGQSDALIRGLLAGAASFGVFLLIALIAPGGMGMGDVKLSFALGLALGVLGWRAVFAGFFLAFLSGAVTGIALMAAEKAGRKSAVPFGPFMAFGAVVTILWTSGVTTLLPHG
ncbi:MAG: A24 family peptidase [Actinomycetota bacterium]